MKLSLKSAESTKSIELNQSVSWLSPLLVDCGSEITASGSLALSFDSAGFFYARGNLTIDCLRPCASCSKSKQMHFDIPIEGVFRPAFEGHVPQDLLLKHDELDIYFIDDDAIDIGQLIYDAVQLALPGPFDTDLDLCDACVALDQSEVHDDTEKSDRSGSPTVADSPSGSSSKLALQLAALMGR